MSGRRRSISLTWFTKNARDFPADERFGLTNQIRRAAVSISSNIAGGTSRLSQTDFARFIEIATGSAFEVVSQAFVGRRRGFLDETDFNLCSPQRMKSGGCSADCENRLFLPSPALAEQTIDYPLPTVRGVRRNRARAGSPADSLPGSRERQVTAQSCWRDAEWPAR